VPHVGGITHQRRTTRTRRDHLRRWLGVGWNVGWPSWNSLAEANSTN